MCCPGNPENDGKVTEQASIRGKVRPVGGLQSLHLAVQYGDTPESSVPSDSGVAINSLLHTSGTLLMTVA
jgi:hypothetical protein